MPTTESSVQQQIFQPKDFLKKVFKDYFCAVFNSDEYKNFTNKDNEQYQAFKQVKNSLLQKNLVVNSQESYKLSSNFDSEIAKLTSTELEELSKSFQLKIRGSKERANMTEDSLSFLPSGISSIFAEFPNFNELKTPSSIGFVGLGGGGLAMYKRFIGLPTSIKNLFVVGARQCGSPDGTFIKDEKFQQEFIKSLENRLEYLKSSAESREKNIEILRALALNPAVLTGDFEHDKKYMEKAFFEADSLVLLGDDELEKIKQDHASEDIEEIKKQYKKFIGEKTEELKSFIGSSQSGQKPAFPSDYQKYNDLSGPLKKLSEAILLRDSYNYQLAEVIQEVGNQENIQLLESALKELDVNLPSLKTKLREAIKKPRIPNESELEGALDSNDIKKLNQLIAKKKHEAMMLEYQLSSELEIFRAILEKEGYKIVKHNTVDNIIAAAEYKNKKDETITVISSSQLSKDNNGHVFRATTNENYGALEKFFQHFKNGDERQFAIQASSVADLRQAQQGGLWCCFSQNTSKLDKVTLANQMMESLTLLSLTIKEKENNKSEENGNPSPSLWGWCSSLLTCCGARR